MNGYGRQTSFPSFLLDSQRAAAAACAASSLNPLALGLSQIGQFGALNQLNANEVYNLLSCFPFYPNPNHAAHLMSRTSQSPSSANSSAAAISLASNPALALAQYQQLQQQPPQQTHPQ